MTGLQVEEDVVVSVDLGVPREAWVLPVDTGAEAMEGSGVGVGGHLVDSTQGETHF